MSIKELIIQLESSIEKISALAFENAGTWQHVDSALGDVSQALVRVVDLNVYVRTRSIKDVLVIRQRLLDGVREYGRLGLVVFTTSIAEEVRKLLSEIHIQVYRSASSNNDDTNEWIVDQLDKFIRDLEFKNFEHLRSYNEIVKQFLAVGNWVLLFYQAINFTDEQINRQKEKQIIQLKNQINQGNRLLEIWNKAFDGKEISWPGSNDELNNLIILMNESFFLSVVGLKLSIQNLDPQ